MWFTMSGWLLATFVVSKGSDTISNSMAASVSPERDVTLFLPRGSNKNRTKLNHEYSVVVTMNVSDSWVSAIHLIKEHFQQTSKFMNN